MKNKRPRRGQRTGERQRNRGYQEFNKGLKPMSDSYLPFNNVKYVSRLLN